MFLTGFDVKRLNTIYVDKNLKYHGLIQAYSRTNRVLGQKKSQGNVVCFRNLKPNTDDAIALFSDRNAQETILVEPYEDQLEACNEAIAQLLSVVPTVDSVDQLMSEDELLLFVRAFRNLMRKFNQVKTYSEFEADALDISCLLYTSPSPRDQRGSRMPSSA